MISELPYTCFADFNPRPSTEVEKNAKGLCGQVKRPNIPLIQKMAERLASDNPEWLSLFLHAETVLVPVPRSSPLYEGATWPSLSIAEALVEKGLGKYVSACLVRSQAIRKSALQSGAENRPLVSQHYESFQVTRGLETPQEITLIDDVVTAGRTAMAAALRLKEAFPEATIRLFAVMRTQSFEEVKIIKTYGIGNIHYFTASSKTKREP